DKLLLVSAYVVFTSLGMMPAWVFIAVLSRDMLIVLGWAVVYILTGNSKIEPRWLGKATTALQMAVAVGKLFNFPSALYKAALEAMIAVTILSACDYVWVG